MENFCVLLVAFATVIACNAPYLAFCISIVAFCVLFATKMDRKKEQIGLDFGQELDYTTASKLCYTKIRKDIESYELRLKRAASQIAEKQRQKILAKIASGETNVWVFVGRYSENLVFRRFLEHSLQCGELEYCCPCFLSVKAKDY
jgi:hypothetical protein